MEEILVCGSRYWTDTDTIARTLHKFPRTYRIIHGDNGYDKWGNLLWGEPDRKAMRGADKLAGMVARELGFKVKRFPPDFKRWPRHIAPLKRNLIMVLRRPKLVIAFHPNLNESSTRGGTNHTVRHARAQGLKVVIVKGRKSTTRTKK